MQKQFTFAPSHNQILASKEDLKTRSQIIRHLKKELKDSQREYSHKYRQLDIEHDQQIVEWKCEAIGPYSKDLRKKQANYLYHKQETRARHIAHAMMKGRSIREIEKSTDPHDYWKQFVYRRAEKLLYSYGLTWID
jgi:Na+-translocating ferredoxin:NAD+ oxidoreductase RnfC subunit